MAIFAVTSISKPKPLGFDHHVADNLASKRLVAGLDIGHVEVGQQIREERQPFVGQVVIEVEHARRTPHHESRAVDDIARCPPRSADHRQRSRRGRIPGRRPERSRCRRWSSRSRFSARRSFRIFGVARVTNARILFGESLSYLSSAITGAVIHQDDFCQVFEFQNSLYHRREGCLFIVGGDNDRQAASVWSPLGMFSSVRRASGTDALAFDCYSRFPAAIQASVTSTALRPGTLGLGSRTRATQLDTTRSETALPRVRQYL